MRKHGNMMGLSAIGSTGSAQGVATERLQLLAKKASMLHTDDGMALTDAVSTTLHGESGLNEEHIRRISEMANNYAFATLFKRASAGHKVIDFEGGPADAAAVVQELRSTGEVPIVEKCAQIKPEERYAPGIDSFRARASTLPAPVVKLGSTRTVDTFKLATDLARAKEWLSSELSTLRVRMDDAARALHKEAMALVKEGHSPAEFAVIFSRRVQPEFAKLALRTVYTLGGWDDIPITPISKKATGWINTEHPIVKRLDDFVKLATDHYSTLRALELVMTQHDEALTLMKEELS